MNQGPLRKLRTSSRSLRSTFVSAERRNQGISAGVLDLRSVSPPDRQTVCLDVIRTGRLLVVDENYEGFGLSGELATVVQAAGIPFKYAQGCTQITVPFARWLAMKPCQM